MSQGMRAASTSGKGKETDSPLEPPEGIHLDFSPVKPILDSWPPELLDKRCVSF